MRSGWKKGPSRAGDVAQGRDGAEAGAVDGGEAVEALDDFDDAEGVGVPEEAAAEGGKARPETQRLMVQGDPHPIAKFRVIGPLSNLADFQKAFSCAPDSPMVRPADQRCEVW